MRKIVDPKTGRERIIPEEALQRRKPNPLRFRDISEDDDGYHPYSDREAPDLQFEEDPWR